MCRTHPFSHKKSSLEWCSCFLILLGVLYCIHTPFFAIQIYETQLNELSSQTQSLSKDVGAKDELLQEARDTINVKV